MSLDTIQTPLSCFPMSAPRGAQVKALEFLWEAMTEGYEDIVIVAPTGIGKTGIGAAFSFWAATLSVPGWSSGSYYLVTQKMLQEQLERDFARFIGHFSSASAGIRSASDYHCAQYGTCSIGAKKAKDDKTRCAQRSPTKRTCPYLTARHHFTKSSMAVTNYPYLFTEHTYTGQLPGRVGLVADECHTLERQITGFVEAVVNKDSLTQWAPHLLPLPALPNLSDFAGWLTGHYVAALGERKEMLTANLEANGYQNTSMLLEFAALENHLARMHSVAQHIEEQPDDWVYWQDEHKGALQSNAKPLSAKPFFSRLIKEMGATRLYMSAYPGPKKIFCRSLGLDPSTVAWLELDSPFPVENRPVNLFPIGSMGRKSQEQTFPGLLKTVNSILDLHSDVKGIIHCHSYGIGKRIHDYLLTTEHGSRMIFPEQAKDRRQALEKHIRRPEPTVIVSPSISEGYSFDEDLARFQIIAKVPYPYLGDRQVAARKQQDPDWYILQTVMTVLQACGRIVRSETDHGHTYILDSDMLRLIEDNPQFFPSWFTKSFCYVK